MKAVVAAFNQEKALVGAFPVIVQPVVEPMDRFAALLIIIISAVSMLSALQTPNKWDDPKKPGIQVAQAE